MVDGAWRSGGEISPQGDIDWYKFEATSDKTYILSWDQHGTGYGSIGSGNYNGAIRVSALMSDGSNVLNGINRISSGYGNSAKIINNYTGTVYVKVEGQSGTSTGTYAVKYETGSNYSPETAIVLVNGAWRGGGEINPQGDVDWYKFEATSDKTYILSWDQHGTGYGSIGSGNYNGAIRVSALMSDGSNVLNAIDRIVSGYGNSAKIINNYTGTVYVKVEGQSGTSTGTYAVKYETNNTSSKETAIALVNGAWTGGAEISPQGEVDWYKFEATSDKTYTLSWDQHGTGYSSIGSGNYTAAIKVSAYRSDGSTVLNAIDKVVNGYGNSAKSISGYTGMVYIKVEGQSATNTGTYTIRYTQD
ncbi:hypothetical protein FACS1894172_03450 [Spirochaetia bacterium]|nr:hypothetical protein FACS1894172_03450 [Spirochaetia bacterium]